MFRRKEIEKEIKDLKSQIAMFAGFSWELNEIKTREDKIRVLQAEKEMIDRCEEELHHSAAVRNFTSLEDPEYEYWQRKVEETRQKLHEMGEV